MESCAEEAAEEPMALSSLSLCPEGDPALALWHRGIKTLSLCGITLKITRFQSTSQPWSICSLQGCITAQLWVGQNSSLEGQCLTLEGLLQHLKPWKPPAGTLNLIRNTRTHTSTERGLQQGSTERKIALCYHFQRLKRSYKDLCQAFTSALSCLFPPFLLSSTILSVLSIHVVWNSNVAFSCIFW